MAPRHLALWAIYTLSKAQHYDDTRDGLWHVCSPAWAVPQLDDDSLNADEAWRVEKYLANWTWVLAGSRPRPARPPKVY